PWVSLYGVFSDNLHMIDERYSFGGYRNTTTVVPVQNPLLDDVNVVFPAMLRSGSFKIPKSSKVWNKYVNLVDRALLYSVHPEHPAWNHPFIVVKKPIFHVYRILQMMGSEELQVKMVGEDVIKDLNESDLIFQVRASKSRETNEIIIIALYFMENMKPVKEHVDLVIKINNGLQFEGKSHRPKEIKCFDISPRTCRGYDTWKQTHTGKGAIDRENIKDLLQFNVIPHSNQDFMIDDNGFVVFQKRIVVNTTCAWIVKYE
ncbi:MAG: hypothetical protein ACTSWN_08775, partial [Promethearchaeota archaeon]